MAANDTIYVSYKFLVLSIMLMRVSVYLSGCFVKQQALKTVPNITISVTDTELKSLEYAAKLTRLRNEVTNRARVAKDEIIAKLV